VLFIQTEFRHLMGKLRVAWDSVATWRMSCTIRSRVPLRFEILLALSHYALLAAFIFERERLPAWLAFASVIRFGFRALLRPKEMFGMCKHHVRVPQPGAFGNLKCAVATVIDPKNRAALGRVQVRLVRDAATVRWMTWYMKGLGPDEKFWPFAPSTFNSLLQQGLKFFGLDGLGITPSSLRAGGATSLLEEGRSIAEIRFAGGWSAEKTLSAYLQEAEAALTLLNIEPLQARRLERTLVAFEFLCEPPPCRLQSILQTWAQTEFKRR
jgi:hypothetical protein